MNNKEKELLQRIHDFLGTVVRDCPDQDMGLEASNLADDVWDAIHATDGLTFGQAIEAMKQGKKVARKGWNGKGMWLCVPLCDGPKEIPATGIWGKPNAEYAENNGGTVKVVPYVTMKAEDGTIVMGWLASQTDMLSEDWCIVD